MTPQTEIFLETNDFRVLTIEARDGSGQTLTLISQKNLETGKWMPVPNVRSLTVHVNVEGVSVHIDQLAALVAGNAVCADCGSCFSNNEWADAEMARSWATMHGENHRGHKLILRVRDANGEVMDVVISKPVNASAVPLDAG